MTENEKPTQEEVDAVAFFAEAVTELSNSAFIQEEFQSLSFSPGNSNGSQDGATFPDSDVVKSALVPFRRVWHQGEPCYFRRVANILYKHQEYTRHFLRPLAFDDDTALVNQMWLRECELSPSDVINLWLNTRYHHVGKSKMAGKFTREDFERYEQKIGPVRFEFIFLFAVQEVTVFLQNILKCASLFLESAETNPSFGKSGVKVIVVRTTPGVTNDLLSPEMKIWRLRRRRNYDAIHKLLEMGSVPDASVVSALEPESTLENLIERVAISLVDCDNFQEAMETGGLCKMSGSVDTRIWRGSHFRRGFVGRHNDGRVFHGEDFLEIARDQFPGFRDSFFRAPFE